ADVIDSGGEAGEVVGRERLQGEAAASRLELQSIRRALERDFGVRGQGAQDVLQLAGRGRYCRRRLRSERSPAAHLDLEIGGQQRQAAFAPVEQYVGQDR